jgi:hypothetical protein
MRNTAFKYGNIPFLSISPSPLFIPESRPCAEMEDDWVHEIWAGVMRNIRANMGVI